jgi:catechol 2,3-dioxygenase-like lactoylglutathione lyase family enzyme
MNIKINHVLVRALDLKKMSQFFNETMNLQEGYRPAFDFPGIWLYSEDIALIHLVELHPTGNTQSHYMGDLPTSADANTTSGSDIVDHIAFSGLDYTQLINRLKQNKLEYFERTIPLTKEHQVFVSGPDHIKLELLFNSDTSTLN